MDRMSGIGTTTGDGDDIPYDVNMKLALIGDSGIYYDSSIERVAVGKTCLLNRYIQGTFSSEFYTTIVGSLVIRDNV